MHSHRCSLRLEVVADVDGRGDEPIGASEGVHLGDVRAPPLAASRPISTDASMRSAEVVPVHRGLEHPRRAGQLGGPHPHPVHLDVVGVPVAAVGVVGGEDVGVLLAEDVGQPSRCLVEVGLPEGVGEVVLRGADHPGVVVARGTRPAGRRGSSADALDLLLSPLPERLLRVEDTVRHLTVLALGGEHQHHPVSGGGCLGQRPTGLDGLVVGVGVEGDEGRHVRRG